MSARQLIVLVLAAVAAVGALLLIRSMGGSRAQTNAEAETPIAGEQVLVAARDIPQGAALAPSDLAVRLFPQESVTPAFVRMSAQPSAQAELVGRVTRRAFAAGEPITLQSIVDPDGRGFMAAQLEPGYRAVAIEIEDANAVGGYLQPNDRVDVIMTQRVEGGDSGGGAQVRSDIVLQDIRVLAVGETTQTQSSGEEPAQIDANVAVLELTQADARVLALAQEQGEISLALRGVAAETVGIHTQGSGYAPSAGAVRVHAFGAVTGGSR